MDSSLYIFLTKQFRIIYYFLVTVIVYASFASRVIKGLPLSKGYQSRVMNLSILSLGWQTHTQYVFKTVVNYFFLPRNENSQVHLL